MRFLQPLIILFGLTLLASTLARAQGGAGNNGGEPRIQAIQRTLIELADFVDSEPVRQAGIFPELKDVSLVEFVRAKDANRVIDIEIRMKTRTLRDRFGDSKMFINNARRKRILFNKGDFDLFYRSERLDYENQYTLIFHELLGLMGIERNTRQNRFNTLISRRIIPFVAFDPVRKRPYLTLGEIAGSVRGTLEQKLFFKASGCSIGDSGRFDCKESVRFAEFLNKSPVDEPIFMAKHLLNDRLDVDLRRTFHVTAVNPERTHWSTMWQGDANYAQTHYHFFDELHLLRVETLCSQGGRFTEVEYYFRHKADLDFAVGFTSCVHGQFDRSLNEIQALVCQTRYPGVFSQLEACTKRGSASFRECFGRITNGYSADEDQYCLANVRNYWNRRQQQQQQQQQQLQQQQQQQ